MDTDLPIFQKTIKEKFQSTPNGATLTSYVATLLLMQAFAKFPEIDSPSKLYDALLSIDSIESPDGPIAIKDRRVQFPLVEKVIHKGKAER